MTKRAQIYEKYTHKILWKSARVNYFLAVNNKHDSKCLFLSSMVMQFFAFEAYLNYLGVIIAEEVWDIEREFFSKEPFRGTLGKYMFLSKLLLLPKPIFTRGNGQVLKVLNEIRNTAAHGKLETGKRNVRVKIGYPPVYTPSELERKTTKKQTEKSLKVIEDIVTEMQNEAISLYPDKIIIGDPFGPLMDVEITDA